MLASALVPDGRRADPWPHPYDIAVFARQQPGRAPVIVDPHTIEDLVAANRIIAQGVVDVMEDAR